MISLDHYLAFVGVSLLVICTPEQNTALTIRNTLLGDRSTGASTAVGVAVGQAVWTVATSGGLAVILMASGPLFAMWNLVNLRFNYGPLGGKRCKHDHRDLSAGLTRGFEELWVSFGCSREQAIALRAGNLLGDDIDHLSPNFDSRIRLPSEAAIPVGIILGPAVGRPDQVALIFGEVCDRVHTAHTGPCASVMEQ